MSAFSLISAEAAAEKLLSLTSPDIIIHVRPDGDAVGSASALCEIYSQLGRRASILSPDKIPERLAFIIEKVGVLVKRESDNEEIVAIDSASPAQLGELFEKIHAPAVMIDHHKIGEQYADGYIDTEASSAAEALADIVDILIGRGLITLTDKLAYALFVAISSDTGCFAYSNASAKTHRLAARLIETGIDFADINRRLFDTKTKTQIKAEGLIASTIETVADGRIGYSAISIKERDEAGLTSEDLETAIDVVRSLRGVEIAFVAQETSEGGFKISLRSVGPNVALVAAKFGGGGHIRAAGCSVHAKTKEEAVRIISEETIKALD